MLPCRIDSQPKQSYQPARCFIGAERTRSNERGVPHDLPKEAILYRWSETGFDRGWEYYTHSDDGIDSTAARHNRCERRERRSAPARTATNGPQSTARNIPQLASRSRLPSVYGVMDSLSIPARTLHRSPIHPDTQRRKLAPTRRIPELSHRTELGERGRRSATPARFSIQRERS